MDLRAACDCLKLCGAIDVAETIAFVNGSFSARQGVMNVSRTTFKLLNGVVPAFVNKMVGFFCIYLHNKYAIFLSGDLFCVRALMIYVLNAL